MAHSISVRKGQIPVTCYLCETETKINWKCLDCDLLMCTKCKEKVHSKFKSQKEHKIIHIKEVGQRSTELDFSNIKCPDHTEQTSILFCKSCHQTVCHQCFAKIHNEHDLIDICEGYKNQIKIVQKIHEKVLTKIGGLINSGRKIKINRKKENSKYLETKNLIHAQNEALKKAIDQLTLKQMKDLDKKWEMIRNAMDKEMDRLTAEVEKLYDQKTEMEYIFNSQNAEEVFGKCKSLNNSGTEDLPQFQVKFDSIPLFIPGEITHSNFGSLQEDVSYPKLTIINQFNTNIQRVFYLATNPDESLWVSDSKVIQRVKPEGTDLKVISSHETEIYGMAVTSSNDLLLATRETTLKQITAHTGELMDSIYTVKPLIATTVHVTKDGNVLVGAKELDNAKGRRAIISMNQEGKHQHSYEHTENKTQIFTHVEAIASTNEGKIFVLDSLSKDGKGRVVVLKQDGDIVTVYNGHAQINSDVNPFTPTGIVTSSSNNIIVSEMMRHILHIMNCRGQLIVYLNTRSYGIDYPYTLCYTLSRQLFIGCSRSKSNTNSSIIFKTDLSEN